MGQVQANYFLRSTVTERSDVNIAEHFVTVTIQYYTVATVIAFHMGEHRDTVSNPNHTKR